MIFVVFEIFILLVLVSALTLIVFIAAVPAFFDIFIATVRLNRAFARDNGLPFSKRLANANSKLGIPPIILNNFVYANPLALNMFQRREAILQGRFRLNGALGWATNLISCACILFMVIFFELPFVRPVRTANMNYTVVILGSTLIMGAFWFTLWVHKTYRGPKIRAILEGCEIHIRHQGRKSTDVTPHSETG